MTQKKIHYTLKSDIFWRPANVSQPRVALSLTHHPKNKLQESLWTNN